MSKFELLLTEVAACTRCAAHLPHGPRPVVQAGPHARLLIVGQAPGRRVHDTGIPWNDPSGDRLRDWLQLPRERFYDPVQVAILPTGFCYPGKGASGDLPPRPECAPAWHPLLLPLMPPLLACPAALPSVSPVLVPLLASASSVARRWKPSAATRALLAAAPGRDVEFAKA